MKPSVGRIVHYVSYGTPGGEYRSECRAAVITETLALGPGSWEESRSGEVGLCVLNPTGQFFNRGVPYHEGDTGHDHAGAAIPAKSYPGGTWHWPEREPSEDSVQVKVNAGLSPQQIKSLTAAVQAELVKQAKRGQRGPGTGV